MLSEEDKTNQTSIEYWFKVVDLDQNGIITPNEMYYFYEEQLNRLEYSSQHESVSFSDILCQLSDMIKPQKESHFTLQSLLENPHNATIFFNSLLNLNKFLNYEQRDLFNSKNEGERYQGYSEWDKFADSEYRRLTAEDSDDGENAEDGVFDDSGDEM